MKTTIEIKNYYQAELKVRQSKKYNLDRFNNVINEKWFSVSDVEQLQKEYDIKANKIMNNFDLNMMERKGAYIAICELKEVFNNFKGK